jgi:hypothetical protein
MGAQRREGVKMDFEQAQSVIDRNTTHEENPKFAGAISGSGYRRSESGFWFFFSCDGNNSRSNTGESDELRLAWREEERRLSFWDDTIEAQTIRVAKRVLEIEAKGHA